MKIGPAGCGILRHATYGKNLRAIPKRTSRSKPWPRRSARVLRVYPAGMRHTLLPLWWLPTHLCVVEAGLQHPRGGQGVRVLGREDAHYLVGPVERVRGLPAPFLVQLVTIYR